MKPTQIRCSEGFINQIPVWTEVRGDIRLTPFYNMRDCMRKVEGYVQELNDGESCDHLSNKLSDHLSNKLSDHLSNKPSDHLSNKPSDHLATSHLILLLILTVNFFSSLSPSPTAWPSLSPSPTAWPSLPQTSPSCPLVVLVAGMSWIWRRESVMGNVNSLSRWSRL